MGKKITQYPASAGNPDVTSLIDISEFDGSIYTSKKLTITQLIDFLNTNLNLGSSFTFKNNTGDTISKGMAVELSSANGLDLPEIALLSSSFSDVGLSQIFIANEDILNGNSGTFIQNGFLDNYYSVGLTLGQKIFWDVASQSLTTVGTDIDQVFVGIVTVVDASGQLFVSPTRGTRTLTSQLVNDGSDTINPFITALDVPTVPTLTSELTNDGDDTINPFISNADLTTATTSTTGYLTSTDWNTFNGKESSLTFSTPLSRATNTISIPVATTSANGYLSSTDWTTFNGKQATLTATNLKTLVDTFTSTTTPVDADVVAITDSAGTTTKKLSWSNFKTTLLAYFDTIFPRITVATTGSVISFSVPVVWNTPASPSSSDLTDDLTSAKIGYIQKIYHNKAVAPTVPAGWVLIGTGTYTTSTLNIIFAEWVSSTRVEYWITKPQ